MPHVFGLNMIRQISTADVKARLEAGEPTLLVDVREPWEHALCHLANDVLLPLGELSLRTDELAPPPGTLVVAYCHHGVRSLRAALVLKAAGLTDVASMAGGIDAWSLHVDPTVPRY